MKDPLLLTFLTLLWVGLAGAGVVDLVVGLLVATFVLWWAPDVPGPRVSGVRALRSVEPCLRLAVVFLVELSLSSLRVAREVVRPRLTARPAVLYIPLDARSDVEITVLAGLLSLTPGLLCVDVAEGGRGIYVHAMYVNPTDLEATREEIRTGLWPHVRRALRAGEPDRADSADSHRQGSSYR